MSSLREKVNKLLVGVQSGDERCKKELFELTYNHLKVIARRYVCDLNDVEDVLQNAYLKAFKYVNALDKSKDGYNWLCKIVQNEAYSYGKDNLDCLPLEEHSYRVDQRDVLDCISQQDELRRYLEGYSALDRQLIYLRFYEGNTYREIAQKLQMKKSNVHRRITKILKEILKK